MKNTVDPNEKKVQNKTIESKQQSSYPNDVKAQAKNEVNQKPTKETNLRDKNSSTVRAQN